MAKKSRLLTHRYQLLQYTCLSCFRVTCSVESRLPLSRIPRVWLLPTWRICSAISSAYAPFRAYSIRCPGISDSASSVNAAAAVTSTLLRSLLRLSRRQPASCLSPSSPHVAEGIPVSYRGREILAFVRRTLIDRQPIGYRRAFLDDYVPNKLAYLPPVVTSHLHELGRTPAEARPAGTYPRDVFDRLLIDLSSSSSSLESYTYSLLDTTELIERDTAAPGKDAEETQMILNHKEAIELLVQSAVDFDVNRFTITNLQALLADNLLEDHARRWAPIRLPVAARPSRDRSCCSAVSRRALRDPRGSRPQDPDVVAS